MKLLDEADALRKLRAEADRRMAEVVPALFCEMFGDPIRTEKGWDTYLLSELGTLGRGKSTYRPRNDPNLYGGEHPFIQTGDVSSADGQITTYFQTYSDAGLAQSRLWPAGTLVITIAANIGRAAVLSSPACFPDCILGFSSNGRVKVEYIRYWFEFMQRQIESEAPQMAQKNINLRILNELVVPVPPIGIQARFASEINGIQSLKSQQARGSRTLERYVGSQVQNLL